MRHGFDGGQRRIRPVLPFLPWRAPVVAFLVFAVGLWPAPGQSPGTGYAAARPAAFTPQLTAYGQVEPISALMVSAAEAGVVEGLKVLPGMHVRAGQVLAQLNGPEITALLLQGEADVRSAQAQLGAAEKSLAIQKRQLAAHLSTRETVHQAESALALAQTGFDNAQSRLQATRKMMNVESPASGMVLALNAANGEIVAAGQPVLTLQGSKTLWLKASYYGADLSAIRIGMTGRFAPAGGGEPIPVRVIAIFGSLAAGEGESIALAPASPNSRAPDSRPDSRPDSGPDSKWINGQFGEVTLLLPQRTLVAVPTRSLILDRGQWWVLVHTAQGDRPQAVVPGPARGWWTFLESGLAPGTQVVVENAYLLFHRGISQSYQTPD